MIKRRDDDQAPPWDFILRTHGWDLVHSYNTALEAWLVLVARRHVAALAELTESEADELGPLIRRVSAALHDVTGCEKTYLAQFAEAPGHRHVHVHLVPRAADLLPENHGPNVFGLLGGSAGEHVPEARMNEIAFELREALAGSG